MPSLTTLYNTFYETYSKKYGDNTCIFLLVGKFYELYALEGTACASSVRRATAIMNIIMKEKPDKGPQGEVGLWGGVPEQSLHKFAQVLTREGWTVVVVDQVKDRADQVVDRIPARILSPGTHVETANQDRMTVAAIYMTSPLIACSVIDLTTGEVFSFQSKAADDILHMLQVYSARETILYAGSQDLQTLKATFGIHGLLHPVPPILETAFQREEYLRKMFRLKTLLPVRTYLSIVGEPAELSLCALLRFIEDHFPQQAGRLTTHENYSPANHMRLSNNILEQLSILTAGQRSVLSLLEKTHSAIGKRAMRERILRPITDGEELERRWSQVEWATELDQKIRRTLEADIKALYDIPRLHYKLAEGSLQAIDVIQMFQSYSATTCLIQNLRDTPLACPGSLELQIEEFRRQARTLLDEEKALKREADEPIGFLTPISGPQTGRLEEACVEIQRAWDAKWEAFCKNAKIPPDSFKLVKKDSEYGWEGARTYLKVIQAEVFSGRGDLKGIQVDSKKSGPITLTSPDIYQFTDRLRTCVKDMNVALKQECVAVCDSLWDEVRPFQAAWTDWLGAVDATLALASVAVSLQWCRPRLGEALEIKGLRHPLLETAQNRMEYVKHDIALGSGASGPGAGATGWLIYGVNASGKSSLMKATGIAAILAQAGSFVPATSMTIRPYDAAFSRIWSQDNLWAGLSSFAVEVSELRDILLSATDRSLVLGDEVCSGTESMSATALVAATLEHLEGVGAHFMFATHLHDLIKVPGFPRPQIAVWHLRVQRTPDGKLIYDRTLQPGSGSCTYGLEVARAMGIPLTLMDRAHEIRRGLGGEATELVKSSWNSEILRKACEICSAPVVRDLEVHHIVPRSEGGGNAIRNLVVLCESCHDAYHAGKLDIGPLQMTSDGLERSTRGAAGAAGRAPRASWTDEEMETIRATIQTYKGRPLTRAILHLEERGIRITAAQLKRII